MSEERKDELKNQLILSACAVALLLVFAIGAAFAWFAISSETAKPAELTIGKVEYTIDTADKVFYSAFELNTEEYYEDEFDPEEGYLPATAINEVMVDGVVQTPNAGEYTYSLEQNTKARFTVSLLPAGATDKFSYTSSDDTVVSVSVYGTMRAIGDVGESAVITVSVTDRDNSATRRTTVFSQSITVTVIASQSTDENRFGYLPGNVNILKNPLTLYNFSTVPSKARVKIEWDYFDYTEEDTLANEYKKITIDELVTEFGTGTPNFDNITFAGNLIAPMSMTVAEGWEIVSPDEGNLTITDINGNGWTVETLSLRAADKTAILTALGSATGTNGFVLTGKMLDGAYAYVCYSTTDITDNSLDYGDVIAANTEPVTGTAYTAVTEMTTSESYASFSSRKVFAVTVIAQARQSKAYEETPDWYNVYCINGHADCAQ